MLATFPDVPKTLAEFVAHRDWRELSGITPVVINDFIVLENGTVIQCNGWSWGKPPTVAELQQQAYKYRNCHVFRRTLGTILNPYRAEHYVNGVVPRTQDVEVE